MGWRFNGGQAGRKDWTVIFAWNFQEELKRKRERAKVDCKIAFEATRVNHLMSLVRAGARRHEEQG